MKTHGFTVVGTDISNDNVKSVHAYDPTLKVYAQDVKKHKGRNYDLITLWDVIEHVKDPIVDLRSLRLRLKKGGVLFIETPNIGSINFSRTQRRWIGFNPFHLVLFDARSIEHALKKAGFSNVVIKTTPTNTCSIWVSKLRYEEIYALFKGTFVDGILDAVKKRLRPKGAVPSAANYLRLDDKGDSLIVCARK